MAHLQWLVIYTEHNNNLPQEMEVKGCAFPIYFSRHIELKIVNLKHFLARAEIWHKSINSNTQLFHKSDWGEHLSTIITFLHVA